MQDQKVVVEFPYEVAEATSIYLDVALEDTIAVYRDSKIEPKSDPKLMAALEGLRIIRAALTKVDWEGGS